MKSSKNYLFLALTLTLSLILLAGCSNQGDNPTDAPTGDNTTFTYSSGIDENGFFEGVTALDYVDPFDYQTLSIPSDVHQVSEEMLQEEIDNILAYYATSEQVTNRAVADGDTVNIDYVGSVDGVEFDNGSTMGQGTDVTIGITNYIDDFLEQLIGHMPGETINVEVTFPEDYQEASLQGKDALFVTTINYIVETVQPKLTDDFIQSNLSAIYGWQTVNEMKEDISFTLQDTAIQQYIKDYLNNEVEVLSVPDELIEYQENAMILFYQEGADYYDMELDEFLTTYGGVSNREELIETYRDSNIQGAKYILILQAIAEDVNISVSEEDLIGYIEDFSSYEEQYGKPYLKQVVLFQKTLEYLADNAVLD